MAKKNEKGPVEKLWDRFKDEYNDNELQRRFDGFKVTEKNLVDRHNALVEPINNLARDKSQLEEIIVSCAKQGMLNADAVSKLKATEQDLCDKSKQIAEIDMELDKERKLIKQYKDASETKLFHYWGMLQAVDETVKPWIQFKEEYKDRIF